MTYNCVMSELDEKTPKSQPSFHTAIELAKLARHRLYEGIELAARVVSCTMGPHGKTVLIQQSEDSHVITKDGVTVSKSIKFADPVKRMGANLVREAASQTNDLAGDGTTTSTVLTHALVKEGLKHLDSGVLQRELIAGMEVGLTHALEELASMAIVTKDEKTLMRIATISANNDVDIGNLISLALKKVGNDGVVMVDDAKGLETTLQVVEGMRFERGYLSPYFVTHADKMQSRHLDARVFVTDKKLKTVQDVVPLLEAVHASGEPLIIIAGDVEAEALQTLIVNRIKGKFPIVALKAPGFGDTQVELLKDICTLTGATLISASTGNDLSGLTTAMFQAFLGRVKKAVVDQRSTTLVGTGETKDEIAKRVQDIHAQMEDVTIEPAKLASLRMRAARLSGGVAVVRVGGATEVEMFERKYRIEDALHAVKAAIDEGIVPGGGVALIRTSSKLKTIAKEQQDKSLVPGILAVAAACEAPLRTISTNADVSPDDVMAQTLALTDKNCGYDAKSGEYVDLIETGIIDPHKVTRLALTHALSVAKTFVSLDAIVFDEADGQPTKAHTSHLSEG